MWHICVYVCVRVGVKELERKREINCVYEGMLKISLPNQKALSKKKKKKSFVQILLSGLC